MDKALQKTFFRHHGFPVVNDVQVLASQWRRDRRGALAAAEAVIGYPTFVKPANSGSSIGTSKARSREDLEDAITEAFRYDRKVLVESAIDGREVEVAVLGNDEPEASPVGEITFASEFYDYQAKYESRGHGPSHPGRHPGSSLRAAPRDGDRGLQGDRLRRVRARRLLPRAGRRHLPQRGQHDPRLHADEHVSEALGSTPASPTATSSRG